MIVLNKLYFISCAMLITYTGTAQLAKTEQSGKGNKLAGFMSKGEKLFKYIPVPVYSYASEGGHTLGLAKYNLIELYKKDTVTMPSRISGVFVVSTKGRINISLATELIFKQNKVVVSGFVNYRKTPEFILGIGNNVKRENLEAIEINRARFNIFAMRNFSKHFYVGGGLDITNYNRINVNSNSILLKLKAIGIKGGGSTWAF